ncbi:hypothetical protein [Kutzneria buriramensis]|nr:hypothetical protein [Kutzneria buriramensis]WKX10683.1 hypothetical protein Q4V64_25560 [Kutzneria buriramensis]GCB47771.1 hypothetical protein SNL152K_5079 [Streptomyces sp. NL15-2K]
MSPREHPGIAPRRAAFDRSRTPLHRIPGEQTATHVINMCPGRTGSW